MNNQKTTKNTTEQASTANNCYVALIIVHYPPDYKAETVVKDVNDNTTVSELFEWLEKSENYANQTIRLTRKAI